MSTTGARAAGGSHAPFRDRSAAPRPGSTRPSSPSAARPGTGWKSCTSTLAAPRRTRGRGWAGANPVVLAARAWTPEAAPAVFICGPTGFVETAASLLAKAGSRSRRHQDRTFRTLGRPIVAHAPGRQRARWTARRGVRRGHHHRGGPVRLVRHRQAMGQAMVVHRRAGPGGPLPELRRGGAAGHPGHPGARGWTCAGRSYLELHTCPASDADQVMSNLPQPADRRQLQGLRRRPGAGRRGPAPGRR